MLSKNDHAHGVSACTRRYPQALASGLSPIHAVNGMTIFYITPGPKVIKLFSMLSSGQLSMKFFLLINVKMPTVVGILTLISRKNSILGLSESE